MYPRAANCLVDASVDLWRLYGDGRELQRAVERWRPVSFLALMEQAEGARVVGVHTDESWVDVEARGHCDDRRAARALYRFRASKMTLIERDLLMEAVREAYPLLVFPPHLDPARRVREIVACALKT